MASEGRWSLRGLERALDGAGRLHALDEARAVAIAALIVAHLGPALLERVNPPAAVATGVSLFARFATPAFVTIFGLTAALVYMRYYLGGADRAAGDRRLLGRARFVLLCALLVAVPDYIAMVGAGPVTVVSVLLATYGILTFYAIAVGLLPVLLRAAARWPVAFPVGAGCSLWLAGSALAFWLWPHAGRVDLGEVSRLYLVSGAYALLPMLGTGLLVIPLGLMVRRAWSEGRVGRSMAVVAGVGAVVIGLGVSGGWLGGELELGALASGELKAPARAWYFAIFAGAALVLVGGLHALPRARGVTWLRLPLRLFGQVALPVYVAHVFLTPGSEALRSVGVGGPWDVLVPLAGFGAFTLGSLAWRARRSVLALERSERAGLVGPVEGSGRVAA